MNTREEYDLWQQLVAHPKWKELCEIAEHQRAARHANIIAGMDNLREEDKQRGEWLGIGLVLSVPATVIETLKVDLDNENQE